jgi:hypothetical protein
MDNRAVPFWRLLILAMLLNILAQTIHETGHWAIYQAFGHNPTWGFIGLVQWWDTPPLHPDQWLEISSPAGEPGWLRLASLPNSKLEEAIAAAAGPFASLLGTVAGLLIARSSRAPVGREIGLVFALLIALVMTLYYLRSPLRSGGDEYDLATALGVSKLLVEIIFGLAFVACLGLGLRNLENWPTRFKWLGAILLGSLSTGVLVSFADGIVRAQVNLQNPFFTPLFGVSLPVLLVNSLTLIALCLWVRFLPRPINS